MNEIIREYYKNINNYEETITAITTFSHVIRWNDNNHQFKADSYYCIGRRMNTTEKNAVEPDSEITPDLIVQMNSKYGIVGEVKSSLPKKRENWAKTFKQLKKYDDDLIGWKTDNEFIDKNDLIFLTHYAMRNRVNDYLEGGFGKELSFDKDFAVIVYSAVERSQHFIFLEKSFGDLSNSELNDRFREIIEVPSEKILLFYSTIKFYDVKPVLPYIMDILWSTIFNQYPRVEQFMEAEGKNIITIEVNIKELVKKLREQFAPPYLEDDRQPKIPKTSWIKEAMDKFVELKHAVLKEGSPGDYIVRYKYSNIKNPLEIFIKEIIEKQKENSKQKKL